MIRSLLRTAHPLLLVGGFLVIISALELVSQGWGSIVADYRSLVDVDSFGVYWPQFVERGRVAYVLVATDWLTAGIELIVLGLLPPITLALFLANWLRAKQPPPPAFTDALVAINTLDSFHSELENPFRNISRALDRGSATAYGLPNPEPMVSTRLRTDAFRSDHVLAALEDAMAGSTEALYRALGDREEMIPCAGTEIALVHREFDVVKYLKVVKDAVERNLRHIADLREELASLSFHLGSCDVVALVERVLAQFDGKFDEGEQMWIVTRDGHDLRIRVRTQPELFATAAEGGSRRIAPINLPNHLARIPVEEALRNAMRAVARARRPRGPCEFDVAVTTYVNDDCVWVCVVDRGDGLHGRAYDELARPGMKTKGSVGLGLGLYIVDALVRMDRCTYLLGDTGSGAIVRLSFARMMEQGES